MVEEWTITGNCYYDNGPKHETSSAVNGLAQGITGVVDRLAQRTASVVNGLAWGTARVVAYVFPLRIREAIPFSLRRMIIYIPDMDADVKAELTDCCNCTICTCWICCNECDYWR